MTTKRIALVTGGMGGIGTAISRRLHNEEFTVIVTHSLQSKHKDSWLAKQQEQGFHFETVGCDIANWDSVATALEEVQRRVGPIDILVNNAGITRDGTLRKMSREDWDLVINTNLNSMFYTTKQVIDGMLGRGWGRIINISSINGQRGQLGQTNYSAAKAGIHGFTMALAREVAFKGVTVNTISPGYIATEMTASMKPEALAKVESGIPTGRLGRPEEIAAMVAFLASEDAAYCNGADFSVNGGLNMQ